MYVNLTLDRVAQFCSPNAKDQYSNDSLFDVESFLATLKKEFIHKRTVYEKCWLDESGPINFTKRKNNEESGYHNVRSDEFQDSSDYDEKDVNSYYEEDVSPGEVGFKKVLCIDDQVEESSVEESSVGEFSYDNETCDVSQKKNSKNSSDKKNKKRMRSPKKKKNINQIPIHTYFDDDEESSYSSYSFGESSYNNRTLENFPKESSKSSSTKKKNKNKNKKRNFEEDEDNQHNNHNKKTSKKNKNKILKTDNDNNNIPSYGKVTTATPDGASTFTTPEAEKLNKNNAPKKKPKNKKINQTSNKERSDEQQQQQQQQQHQQQQQQQQQQQPKSYFSIFTPNMFTTNK